MAEPQYFTSQQSEIVINVSENHSSTTSSPLAQPPPQAQTHVEQSPIIQAFYNETVIPESAESADRVQDSYQESLRHPVPALHTEDEEEEDLYGLSPSGKASLDTAVAAIKSTQEEQVWQHLVDMRDAWIADMYKPAMPPARNPIDALIDAGATAAPNALNTFVETEGEAHEHAASSPERGYAALDAKLKTIDAKASKAPSKSSKGRKCDPAHSDFEPTDSDLVDDEDGAIFHKQQPAKKGTQAKSKASNQSRANVSLKATDEPKATAHTVKTTIDDTTRDAGKSTTAQQAHKTDGKKVGLIGTKTAPIASSAKAKARPQLASLSQPLLTEPNGRPVRRAKKTALGRLKAKRGKENDDAMSGTDDESEDDGSSFGTEDDKAYVFGRGRTKAHLPTPVTKSNISKHDGTSKPSGKLQSVKSKAPPTTAGVKKASGDVSRPSDISTNSRTRKDTSFIGEGVVANSTETVNDASKTVGHKYALASEDDYEQDIGKGKLPARRPGALRRPARSASRGRISLRESRYDFPSSTPRVKRNNRSVSKTSRASVKPGPIRQRMQSESVKHHDDSDMDNSRQLSASRQVDSKEVETGSPPRKKFKTQRKSKDPAPKPKLNNQNSSTLKSKCTDDAANARTLKNATGVKMTTSHQKPGSSQGNAIMIEQEAQSSLSRSSSPYHDTTARPNDTGQVKHRQEVQRLQTPAAMPSSPPGANTFTSDKPTIIAFSKRGPRNQGIASSSKDAESIVAPTVPSARTKADADISGLRDQNRDPSRTLFPSQNLASVTVKPSNVTVVGDGIFADFIKNGKNKALTSLLQRQSTVVPQRTKRKCEPEQQRDTDDGFFAIGDFDDTTLVNDDNFAERTNVQRTASQIAMPPPNGPEKIVKKVIAHNSLINSPTKAGSRPAIEEPAPEPRKPKKVVLAKTAKVEIEPKPTKQVTKAESKNGTHPTSLQKTTNTVPLQDTIETRSTKVALTEQKAQPKRKAGLHELHSGFPKKKTKVLQTNPPEASSSTRTSALELRSSRIPQGAKVVIADPAERSDRRRTRSSRRTTQGSQGVDILGSPYPKELDVPIQTTALEIFSQQADLSSDQMASSDAVVAGGFAGRLNLAAVPRILPPTHRKPMSSNGKPLPAAPTESSRAATRIASGPLAEQLLTTKHEQSEMEDPFTSSHNRVPMVKPTAGQTDFKQALREHGITIDQQERTTNYDEEDPDKTVVNRIDDLESDDFKELASPTSASDEPSNASTVSAAQKALENVGDWRNTLKPHQTHLFDSLVIASHKLVRHMVDSETAHRDIVADYRRQGEIVVTELERLHAREFQQHAAGMQELKKRAADGLASHGRRLKQDVKDAERARLERKEKAKLSRDGLNGMIGELLVAAGLA